MKKTKLVVIGGGSSYTPELMEGIIKYHHLLSITEVWLVDIPEGEEKLKIIEQLSNRMVTKANSPIKIIATFDRKKAIQNATYIITQIRVGQLEMRRNDEYIPMKHGVIGQETTGPGGFMKALRTIPVLLDICRDIEELAPNAWLLNFTNPAGVVTEAILNHTQVKAVGLCNNPINFYKRFAAIYDVDMKDVSLQFVGINHLSWITDLYINGQSHIDDILTGKFSGYEAKNIPALDWDTEFLQSLGAIPSGYHKYYYQQDDILRKQIMEYDNNQTRADYVQQVEKELFELYSNEAVQEKPKILEKRGGAYYSEAAINLIKSIHLNEKKIHTLNVKNNGTIPCLPNHSCIEVNCLVENHKITPLQIGEIKPSIRGLLQIVNAYEELTVKAAIKGDKDLAYQALTLHPLVPSYKKAKIIFDEMLTVNQAYLPQFKGGM